MENKHVELEKINEESNSDIDSIREEGDLPRNVGDFPDIS